MIVPRLLRGIVLALMSSALISVVAAPLASIEADSHVARMANIEIFAFGGTGFAMTISVGETEYRALLSHPSAAADFEEIFAMGNPQAKAYALVGLRQTSPKRFQQLATSLEKSRTLVKTMRGCNIFEVPMFEIVRDIRAGVYSRAQTHRLVPPR